MIIYTDSLDNITAGQLGGGFFEGWTRPLSPEMHLRTLHAASAAIVALDTETNQVVGYITMLTDGLITAFIPNLEVLSAYQRQGIGSELMRRMLEKLERIQSIDLMCDPGMQPFYARFGMRPLVGMAIRNFNLDNPD
jgi:predicted N-acetyltransferase YhbS